MPQKPRKRDATSPSGQQAGLGYVPTRLSRDGGGGDDIIISGPPGNVSVTLNPSVLARMGAGSGLGEDGQDGERGAPGAPGVVGPTGPTGPAGSSGAGIPGVPGRDGDDGEMGMPIPGLPGAMGAPGPTGPTGPAGGLQGVMGFPGFDGEEGPEAMAIPGIPGPAGATGAAGGALVLITEVVTSGSQSTVTFSSIPTTWRDLEVRVRARGTASATNVIVALRFNSDSGNNYDYVDAHWFSNFTAFGPQAVAQASIQIGYITAATGGANYTGGIQVRIYDYKGTTFYKEVDTDFGATLGVGSGQVGGGKFSGAWRNTAAINAVLVLLSSGNFVDNSVVSLYGCS